MASSGPRSSGGPLHQPEKFRIAQGVGILADESGGLGGRNPAMPPGRPSAETHLKIVEEVFGDLDRLEKIWLRHENAP